MYRINLLTNSGELVKDNKTFASYEAAEFEAEAFIMDDIYAGYMIVEDTDLDGVNKLQTGLSFNKPLPAEDMIHITLVEERIKSLLFNQGVLYRIYKVEGSWAFITPYVTD